MITIYRGFPPLNIRLIRIRFSIDHRLQLHLLPSVTTKDGTPRVLAIKTLYHYHSLPFPSVANMAFLANLVSLLGMDPDITFGVEFELLIGVRPLVTGGGPCPNLFPARPQDRPYDNVKRAVAITLTNAGLPTIADTSAYQAIAHAGEHQFHPTNWMVTACTTASSTRTDYEWAPIEVKSPPFNLTRDSLLSIGRFCDIMKNNFAVEVNASCDLHVHLGIGTSGFSLPCLKNLVRILYTFEPALASIHPANRVTHPRCTNLRLMTSGLFSRGWRVTDVNEYIDACTRIAELKELIDPEEEGRKYAYNFINQRDDGDDGYEPRTVEFRQHVCTLDGERVMNWVRFLGGLAQYANQNDTHDVGLLCLDSASAEVANPLFWSDEGIDFATLCQMVGMPESSAYWM
jgi:hypothetical protein